MSHNPNWLSHLLRSARRFSVRALRLDLRGDRVAWLLVATLVLTACGQVVSSETPTMTPAAEATPTTLPSTIPPRPTATLAMPTAAPPDTPAPSPPPLIHIVQPGETLIGIAIQYGVTLAALQSANGIDNPESLQMNQELIIPTGEESRGDSMELLLPTLTPVSFAIEGVAFYETPVGSLWCLGEVVNSTASSLENVGLRVALYNAAGEELMGGNASAALDLIHPGGRAPFGILFFSPPASFDQFRVTPVRAEASGEEASRYVTLELARTEAGPVGSLFEVNGSVTNPGQSTATSVMVVVTTYDAEGLVTGFRQAKLPHDLPPGASAEFSVSLMPNNGLPASYHVAVQGRLADQ
jgi:LysM repeat protein